MVHPIRILQEIHEDTIERGRTRLDHRPIVVFLLVAVSLTSSELQAPSALLSRHAVMPSSPGCVPVQVNAAFGCISACPATRRNRGRGARPAARAAEPWLRLRSSAVASRPVLPRHARLKFDQTRQRWVILAPERVLAPDEIAVEIMQLCDGARNVAQMIDQLAAKYTADRAAIGTDVIAMLQDLADKGFLTEAREKTS